MLPVLLVVGFLVLAFGIGLVFAWPRPRVRDVGVSMSRRLAEELSVTRLCKAAHLQEGFVQVAGTAHTAGPLKTPIWGIACVAYRAEVLTPHTELFRSAGHLQSHEISVMRAVHSETGATVFDIIDDSGRVRVEADSRVRLAMKYCRSSEHSLFSRLTPEAKRVLDSVMDTLGGKVEVREFWVPVGANCCVVGQAALATATTPARLMHGEREILIGDGN